MGRTPSVGMDVVHQIKARIWDDADHKTIQEEFNVPYQMSVNIKAGRQYDYIPWPDGSIGGLPKTRVDQITANKRYATRMGKSPGAAPTVPIVSPEVVHSLNAIAREHGFNTIHDMEMHYKNIAENERIARINEEQRLKNEAYEESERIRMLPENVEARRLALETMPIERDDLCDPDLQEKYTWEEVLGSSQNPVVLVADSEGDPALKLAIQICFKLFTSRQWGQDHVLKNIYLIKGKIEKFWDENPERRPEGELNALLVQANGV